MLTLGLEGVHRVGDHLVDIRAGSGTHRCRQRPFHQRRGAQSYFRRDRRVEKIHRRLCTKQGTADIHHYQHMVGIGNRLDRLHHLNGVGTDGILRIVDTGGNGYLTVTTH